MYYNTDEHSCNGTMQLIYTFNLKIIKPMLHFYSKYCFKVIDVWWSVIIYIVIASNIVLISVWY